MQYITDGRKEEIRYRRIGNERRIPFAFWPDSQECLHRTLLIVSSKLCSFIHAKFDNKTRTAAKLEKKKKIIY